MNVTTAAALASRMSQIIGPPWDKNVVSIATVIGGRHLPSKTQKELLLRRHPAAQSPMFVWPVTSPGAPRQRTPTHTPSLPGSLPGPLQLLESRLARQRLPAR